MIRRALVAAALATTLAGCPWHARAPAPQATEGEWGTAREAATRRAFLYDGLEHRAHATATHLSLAVREARSRRLAVWLDWTPRKLEEKLAQERTAAAGAEEFLVSFYSADSSANDLDAPKSVWTVTLEAGSEELEATHVTATDMDVTLRGLFPFVGPFDTAYVVTCPRSASGDLAGRPFRLELASALGRLTLDWTVAAGDTAAEPVQPVP